MKIRQSLHTAAALLAGALLALGACVQDEESARPGDEQTVSVQMQVSTRAGGSSLQPGTEDAITSLRVYAYVGNVQVGYLSEPTVTPEDDGTVRFWMDLDLPTYSPQQTVDFYLVANENNSIDSYQGGTSPWRETLTRAELEDVMFTALDDAHATLPMSAKKSQAINPGDLVPSTGGAAHTGHQMWDGVVQFELERAVAKVGMYFACIEEGTDLQINSIRLYPASMTGNYMFVPTAEKLQAVQPVNGNDGRALLTQPLTVDKVVTDDQYDASKSDLENNYTDAFATPVYLFENAFGSADANVAGADGKGYYLAVTYEIDNRVYTKNVYLPAVERNHCYNIINRIKKNGGLAVSWTVNPWEADGDGADLEFTSQFNGSLTAQLIKTYTADGGQRYVAVAEGQDAQQAERYAQFNFVMTSPVGARWTAHLTDGDNFEFVGPYSGNGVTQEEADQNLGRVTLTVRPRRPFVAGETYTTRLYIEVESLEGAQPINVSTGSGQSLPFPGEETYIDIIQISTADYDNITATGNNP